MIFEVKMKKEDIKFQFRKFIDVQDINEKFLVHIESFIYIDNILLIYYFINIIILDIINTIPFIFWKSIN